MAKAEEKKSPPSRRQFLASSVAAIGGIALTGLYFLRDSLLFLAPGSRKKEFTKYLVAKVDEIPIGKAKKITIRNKPVFIVRLPEGFKVFSGICTHLGCIVKWKEREKYFYCPCHKGVFDKDGTVLAGTPPRPLDEFKVEIDNSLVFIWIEKRKRGIQS
jgi:cytochrome b6-f complex iron-sulfur subunit